MLPPELSALNLSEPVGSRLADVLRILGVLPGEPLADASDLVGANWRNPQAALPFLTAMFAPRGPFAILSASRDAEGVINIDVTDKKQHALLVRAGFDDKDRVRLLSISRPPPEGVEIRPVREEDYPLLAELERESPIETGADSYRLYRPNLAQLVALQDGGNTWVAWRRARPVAFRGFALKTLHVGGQPLRLSLSQFAVVHPQERGHGFMNVFMRQHREELAPNVDHFLAHFDEGNSAVIATLVGAGGQRLVWRRKVKMLHFKCAPSSADFGAIGTRNDAGRIAESLNAAHAGKVLFDRQDAASVEAKLSRVPQAYSFQNVLMSEHAFMGVWLSGEQIEDTKNGVTSRRRLATVLDYGFDGDEGLEELLRLLAAWCARCGEAGATHLVLYTNDGAREAEPLIAQAAYVDSFLMQSSLPEPPANGPPALTDPLFI